MVAATIDPREIAAVFDDLAAAFDEAAPPAADVPPSSNIGVWGTMPASDAAKADRLMHAISLLGEHVGGCWSWVPSRNPEGPDGTFDEDVAWELEYSPPPASLLEVIGSRGVLDEATLKESLLDDSHMADSSGVHLDVLRLVASAVDELQRKAFSTSGRFGTQVIRTALSSRGEEVLRVHDDLAAVVSDIQQAAQEQDGSSRGAWVGLHDRLVTGFDIWIERVLPAIPLDRVRRQAVKRDMPRWVGYVAQYALLLRGNAASLELLRMVGYVKHACRALGKVIDTMVGDSTSASHSPGDRFELDSKLVSRAMESRWGRMLGTRAEGVGQLAAQVVGPAGQTKPVQQQKLLDIAAAEGLITPQAHSARAASMEAVLLRMQLCGLAAKVPVAAFREGGRSGRGSTPRRSAHAARDWWINPLGVVLSSPRH